MTISRQRVYTGRRTSKGEAVVFVIDKNGDSRFLQMHPEHCNHSPTGFEWGYGGSGPAQLAFEILFDVFGHAEFCFALHQDFKRERIAGLDRKRSWQIGEGEVIMWAAKHVGVDRAAGG